MAVHRTVVPTDWPEARSGVKVTLPGTAAARGGCSDAGRVAGASAARRPTLGTACRCASGTGRRRRVWTAPCRVCPERRSKPAVHARTAKPATRTSARCFRCGGLPEVASLIFALVLLTADRHVQRPCVLRSDNAGVVHPIPASTRSCTASSATCDDDMNGEEVEREPPLRPSMTGRWAQRWLASLMRYAASGQRDLRPCRQGHADLQDAILVVGLDLLQLCPGGQMETAIEPAVPGLALVVVFVLDRGLCFALAADHQVAVVYGELDVAFLHPRQLGLDDQRALVLENVGLGLEGGAQSRPAAHAPFEGPTVEELGEQVTADGPAHQPLARLPVLIEELGEQVAAQAMAHEALARLLVLVEQLGEQAAAEAAGQEAGDRGRARRAAF